MTRHPLLPCPRCMNRLVEVGLVYPGGKVIARELAPRLRSVLKGAPVGVQYECARCGSIHTLATAASPRVA